ncbi:hypothetical protein Desor_4635 [Desulfosporosinus orientis DSM 765]|uniref:Uncharacterized protein n=1 Tax=Desulfosporosinus orientis (strain ATCC 19365 / DSM 765 / NCIMB 8382 / VKM B-1628 / Singapore I) TaxID=768706 RepID=G7WE63_DESOD|nr:hypothetical protein Desor_4635 [Desulfosporosinus orientis DSM 765]
MPIISSGVEAELVETTDSATSDLYDPPLY